MLARYFGPWLRCPQSAEKSIVTCAIAVVCLGGGGGGGLMSIIAEATGVDALDGSVDVVRFFSEEGSGGQVFSRASSSPFGGCALLYT